MDVNIQKELSLIKESVLNVVTDTEAIYLFGSYAYGVPHADSDLDIYVVIPDSVEENPLNVGVEVRHGLYKKLTMPMDLLVGKRSVFNRRKNEPTLQKIIAQDGVKFYGQ